MRNCLNCRHGETAPVQSNPMRWKIEKTIQCRFPLPSPLPAHLNEAPVLAVGEDMDEGPGTLLLVFPLLGLSRRFRDGECLCWEKRGVSKK